MASPAVAAPSLCAHLPDSGQVAARGPDDVVPARPRADRRLGCPPGYQLDLAARPAACRRDGQRAVAGNPAAACRASLALGPVAAVPAHWRPTRSCPSNPLTALIRLEGANVGLADVKLSTQSPGVTVTSLDEDTAGPPPEARPSAQGCFAHACRLVQLAVAADAGDAARLELAIAGGASETVLVPLTSHCPDPLAARPRQLRPAPAQATAPPKG
jgi:hypothetical protein